VTNLPSGQTLRGDFADRVIATKASQQMQFAITFAFPLSSAPAAHYIVSGEAPPAQCAGTAAEPKAAPGNLCVYEGVEALNANTQHVFDPVSGEIDKANRYGAGIVAVSIAEGEFRIRGSWAVTAP
jgi:hypothetical protein